MPISPNKPTDQKPSVRRGLERAASEINPFLAVVAIGLGILDLTFYVGMVGSRQVVRPADAAPAIHSAAPSPRTDWQGADFGR